MTRTHHWKSELVLASDTCNRARPPGDRSQEMVCKSDDPYVDHDTDLVRTVSTTSSSGTLLIALANDTASSGHHTAPLVS